MDILKKFSKQRIKEINNHQTISKPELDQLEPLLREIIEGKARSYIIAVEYKDGIQFVHKYQPSLALIKAICGD